MTTDPSFIAGSLPEGYVLDLDPFLYNSHGHLSLQPESERHDFYMISPEKRKVLGRAFFFIRDGIACSPLHAPFGSFELSAKASLEKIFQFTAFVMDHLRMLEVKQINIKNYAQVYAPEQTTKLATALHRHGFSIHPVINHHLTIDQTPFEEKIHKMERRRLKKCKAAGYQFREEEDSALPDVYAFIRKCREEKGQPLNIDYGHLLKSMAVLPGKYRIFSAKKGETLVASTILVTVSQKVMYNFLPASLSAYNHNSPMIYLLSELYGYCRSGGIPVLDLGISATEDQQQFSLMQFKSHLGAETSLKFTFKKQLT